MLNSMKVMSFLVFFIFSHSCGFNALSFLEGEIPVDEKTRMERGETKPDGKKLISEAKEELPEEVVSAVNAIEEYLFEEKKDIKDIPQQLIDDLEKAIPEEVKEVITNGTVEEKEELVSSYSKLIEGYANDSSYDQNEFLKVLLDAAGNDKSTNLLEGECSEDMSLILEVTADFRTKYCKPGTEGLIDGLSAAEFSSLLGVSFYLISKEDGSFVYSPDVITLEGEVSENIQWQIDGDNLNTYLLDFFFPLVYTSCYFVKDDCSFDSSGVDQAGLQEIWDHFQSSLPLEIHLKDTGLLPDLSFSSQSIIDAVNEDVEEMHDVDCGLKKEYGELQKNLCSLRNYLYEIGAKCSDEAGASTNDCAAQGTADVVPDEESVSGV